MHLGFHLTCRARGKLRLPCESELALGASKDFPRRPGLIPFGQWPAVRVKRHVGDSSIGMPPASLSEQPQEMETLRNLGLFYCSKWSRLASRFYPGTRSSYRDRFGFRSTQRLVATVASQPCNVHLPLNFSSIEGRSSCPGTQSAHRSASTSSTSVRSTPRDKRISSSEPWNFSYSSASASTSPCRHLATSELSPSGWLIWEDILPRSNRLRLQARTARLNCALVIRLPWRFEAWAISCASVASSFSKMAA